MFEIRDELGQKLASEPSFDEAEKTLDDLCAKAHAQAVASGEGTNELWHHFTVIETDTGDEVAFRDYNPDPSQPYEPLSGGESR